MAYFDIDYFIEDSTAQALEENYNIIDVYFIRKPHYCKSTKEYWKNRLDESLYLKVKEEKSEVERAVLLAKNKVNEYEMYFEDDKQKQQFYQEFRGEKFYHNLEIYSLLSDKQVVQFLNIMKKKINDYNYTFQYCDHSSAIKNIISSCLKKQDRANSSLSLYSDLIPKQNSEMESMLKEGATSNIIDFKTSSK